MKTIAFILIVGSYIDGVWTEIKVDRKPFESLVECLAHAVNGIPNKKEGDYYWCVPEVIIE